MVEYFKHSFFVDSTMEQEEIEELKRIEIKYLDECLEKYGVRKDLSYLINTIKYDLRTYTEQEILIALEIAKKEFKE